MSDRTFAHKIKKLKSERRTFRGAAAASGTLSFFARLTKINAGAFAFEKVAADPEKGWALTAFERKARSLAGAGEALKELKAMQVRARGSVLARIDVVSLLRKDLAAFEQSYPASMLSAGFGDRR